MQLRIVWEEILKRFGRIEMIEEPKRVMSSFVKGYETLMVPYRARSGARALGVRRQGKNFFFEKKKQKTFVLLCHYKLPKVVVVESESFFCFSAGG